MSYPRTPHAWNCDCIGCENLRDEGLPTDGRCFECQAPHNAPHRDGCSGQFGESNAIRVLAAPFADHPDYRDGWRP